MSNHPSQDPWGKPGQSKQPEQSNEPNKQPESPNDSQQPPDIEDIFNNLLKKLGGSNNHSGNNGSSTPSLPLAKALPIAVIIAGLVWAGSGFYTIKEAERGVVTRFGQLHSIVQPGLNWKPTFIDEVRTVNVEKVQELRTQGSMLTQDENMVKVELTVQYRVADPVKYLFSVTKPDDSLTQATDSALRYTIGHMSMDEILTTGRAVVREQTWKALNEIIKPYDMGLEVIDVNFQSARPPEEVKDAFDDAIKAQEDEQRYIREADAYAREQEPIARGEAQRIVEQATAYKEQVVLDAQGEVERYKRLLPEFNAAPELTRQRLYIQAMEKIMAKTPKVMLDSGNNLTVLPLDKVLSANANNMPNTADKNSADFHSATPQATSVNGSVNMQNGTNATQAPASTTSYQIEDRKGRFN
ncbi:MAG: FtsH protease activity modulator HflK [Pasteurellaceae bacterium]|nr:FtsH protease activity modulator HflK [Pasteurellaceae bacterium]